VPDTLAAEFGKPGIPEINIDPTVAVPPSAPSFVPPLAGGAPPAMPPLAVRSAPKVVLPPLPPVVPGDPLAAPAVPAAPMVTV